MRCPCLCGNPGNKAEGEGQAGSRAAALGARQRARPASSPVFW